MMAHAYREGINAASKRFGVREASLMELLLGVGTPMAVRAGLNVLAPKVMPAIERGLEMPFKGVKGVAGGLARTLRSPATPAEALMHQLSSAPVMPSVHAPTAQIARAARLPTAIEGIR